MLAWSLVGSREEELKFPQKNEDILILADVYKLCENEQ
jgi:hypothetical protein